MVNTASSVSSFQLLIEGQGEALHGNQRRCHKRFSSCISFVRL